MTFVQTRNMLLGGLTLFLLMSVGARADIPVSDDAIMKVLASGNTDEIKKFFDEYHVGPMREVKYNSFFTSGSSTTVLNLAAEFGNIEVLKILLRANGVSINSKDKEGLSPAHYATFGLSSVPVLKFLSSRGADLSSGSGKTYTPLDKAALSGNLDAVKFLVAHGAKQSAHLSNDLNFSKRFYYRHCRPSSQTQECQELRKKRDRADEIDKIVGPISARMLAAEKAAELAKEKRILSLCSSEQISQAIVAKKALKENQNDLRALELDRRLKADGCQATTIGELRPPAIFGAESGDALAEGSLSSVAD